MRLITRADLPEGYVEDEYLKAEFLKVTIDRGDKRKVILWFSLKRVTTDKLPVPRFSKEMLGPTGFAILPPQDMQVVQSVEFQLYRRKGLGSHLERELLTV